MALTRLGTKAVENSLTNITDQGTEGTKVASGTSAQRGSTAGQFRFNSTTGKFEGRNASGFVSIEPSPVVSSVNVNNMTQKQIDDGFDLVITGENFASGDTVKFIANDNTEFISPTVTINSSTQITARVTSTIDATKEPYKVQVTSSNGLVGSLASAFNIDGAPIWTTAAGNIGTVEEQTAANLSIAATDAEGDAVTYAETGGSVLSGAGFSMSSAGAITGTAPSVSGSATYTFNARATSGTNFSDRTFNIIVADAPTGGNNTYTYTYGGTSYTLHKFTSNGALVLNAPKTVDIFMIGGGGGGGQHSGAGGGAGGLVWLTNQTMSTGTYSAVIGAGGQNASTGSASGGEFGDKGNDTTFFGKTAMGGGGGGYQGQSNTNITNGGCGGGASRTQGSSAAGSSIQNSTYGYGQGFGGAYSGANGGANNYAAFAGGGTGQAGQVRTGGDGASDFINSAAETTAFLLAAVAGTDSSNNATTTSSSGTLYIGGGGGGSDQSNLSTYFPGGKGGGGRGNSNNNNPTGGMVNTGSGSGGQSYQNDTAHTNLYGGSGLVIVRYTT